MDTGFDKAKLLRFQALLTKHLSDPVRLRLVVLTALTLAAIAAVYVPLSGRIQQEQMRLQAERKRFQTIAEVQALRRQVESYRAHIGEQSDTNEWVQYILNGLRKAQVRLRDMESKEPKKVGPYVAINLAVEVEGAYPALKSFMEWLEQSERLLRVDSLKFEKRPGALSLKVYILGLGRKNAAKT